MEQSLLTNCGGHIRLSLRRVFYVHTRSPSALHCPHHLGYMLRFKSKNGISWYLNGKIPSIRHTGIPENGCCHFLLLIMDNCDTPLIRGALLSRMKPCEKRRYKHHAVQL
jgi:hypothetical protein